MIDKRLLHAPQLKEYDHIGQDFLLYSMFIQKRGFSGQFVNTDSYGFRISFLGEESVALDTEVRSTANDSINILVGGSTVFGVGASSDKNTISSILASRRGEKWINLGLRAGNSFQEYINLIQFLPALKKRVKNIVFFSGINDIYLNLLDNINQRGEDTIFRNSFFSNGLKKMYIDSFTKKRKLVSKLISMATGSKQEQIIHLGSISEMMNFKNIDSDENTENRIDYYDRIEKIFFRNFMLYSALKKELNVNISYILQPYLSWTNKKLHTKEIEILDYLDKKDDSQNTLLKHLDHERYGRVGDILKRISRESGIDIVDSNSWTYGNADDFSFVDRVHLTDQGNKFAADIIEKYID